MEADLAHPQFWRREGGGRLEPTAGFGRASSTSSVATEPVAARLLVRGRRVRPVGRQAAAHRGRVGVRGVVGPRRRASAATRGATTTPTTRSPTSARPASGPTRRAPPRRRERVRACEQMVGDVWEWTASDFAALPGVPVVPVPRVQRGVLPRRPGVQGAARRFVGDAPERDAHDVPQLGLPDPPPDLQRLPLRPGRLSPDLTRTMCRHLAYLGPPVDLDVAAARAAALAGRPGPGGALPAERARRTPTASASGWYAAGARRRGRAQRYRNAEPIWDDAGFAASSRRARPPTAVLAAVRLASPGAPIEVSGNAPFVAGPWLFSLNGVVHGHFDGVGDELRATRVAAPRRRHRGRHRLRGAVRLTLDRSTPAPRRRAALAATVDDGRAPARPAA